MHFSLVRTPDGDEILGQSGGYVILLRYSEIEELIRFLANHGFISDEFINRKEP